MDALYSLSLLFALAAGGLGTFLFVYLMILHINDRRSGKWMAWIALGCGVVALISGVLSAFLHYVFGHGPDSAEPMLAGRFFMAHKAYWLVLVLAFLSHVGWVRSARISDNAGQNAA